MAKLHRVEQGECLPAIAKKYGFADYLLIYDHPNNAQIKRDRPDPHVLYPGDAWYIPDKQDRQEQRSTGRQHDFRLNGATRTLCIAVEDPDGRRAANQSYLLTVQGKQFDGTTDGEGMLTVEIPFSAQEGRLSIEHPEGIMEWQIMIGHLNPARKTRDDGLSGIQTRLSNLGYDVGPIDGKPSDRLRDALRAFQLKNPPLEADGQCNAETVAKLIEKHGR